MELYDKYQEEFKLAVAIDSFNLEKIATTLPAVKHFWVARYHNTMIRRNKLIKKKEYLRKECLEQLKVKSPVKLDKNVYDNLKNQDVFVKLEEDLVELEICVNYLKDCCDILKFMGNDIKNIILIKTMEEE